MRKISKRQLNRSGITLIELVIVILILGIMSAVAAPRYVQVLSSYRADATAKRIAMDLEHVRRNARRTSTARTITFSTVSNNYTMTGINDPNHPSQTYIVTLSQTGYTATLVSADFGGGLTVTFDIYGKPDNSGTIVIQSGSDQKTITLDATTGKTTIS